ncbi:FtsQ-type POTRA domain-containing protein [Oscillatoria sp. FACHB-1406]|uniref:cell division protein FtsQ/DivIB n=1 Tax=Oscillatoria sp. FACHB-1406 TaxID=2692846 RepID=UPI00168550F8|nr:FtsQ-type POTRA domain-containing protein [Oscillatoria sp. FACHB-1406]MBD2576285.1 FtsQ-type POTRA domain-containing protein [Oscillatoria sp. FACHB-1406]
MTSIGSVSPHDLKARRAQLKRRRQLKLLQAFWRLLLVSGMAGGLTWGLTQLNWTIERPEQIAIEGNQLLSPTAIRTLLRLSYPQPLWQVRPQVLSQQMESAPPIAEATVTRKLLPPGLTVTVKERQPVARVLDSRSQQETGFLDERGIFLPEGNYAQLLAEASLPELQALGIDDSLRLAWPEIYQAVRNSPVQIFALDFRNRSNSILTTELGIVHLGQYQSGTPRLTKQLEMLAQMRELPTRLKTSRLAYIDLTNPDFPTVQLR